MHFTDLLGLISENLNRRKARVALTAIGVVIGTAAVVVLVSLGIGLQQSATQNLFGIGDLTQINVYPQFDFPEGGPGVAVPLGGRGEQPQQQVALTEIKLKELAAIPHVAVVIPQDYIQAQTVIKIGRLEGYVNIVGVGVDDLEKMGLKPQSGSLKLEKGVILMGIQVPTPNFFYDPRQRPGQPPPEIPDLLDKQVQLVVTKYTQDGQPVNKNVPLRVGGIIAQNGGQSDYSVYMLLSEVDALSGWAQGTRINRAKTGYNQVIVKVDEVNNVLTVAEQIKNLGFQADTPQEYVSSINNFYVILQVIFGGVGAIALLVAAIGIANTMTMAILERTREIGLMKAIGATNRDVLNVFLGEAAGIGFLGGLGGVAVGWGFGQVVNVLALAYFAGQATQPGLGGPPPSVAVVTPAWLMIGSLVFATFIGLLSGLYPALRAATLVPVMALKYE
ncbi:MAG: ABC transporter permease [Anaerolineales bacterium]